ncbi:MAG: hypothetical protein ACT4N2_06640 [Hyphomicrobium sp.]
MLLRSISVVLLAIGAALPMGCATPESTELGESKAEFEQSAQGGNYRFQYVAEGPDGYRTVMWRQGESLSDDRRDEKLVAGVVRSVFLERFCKEIKEPVSLAEGSPSPMGAEGKWSASLRCAKPAPPPPKAKPEKKAKPKPEAAPVAEAKPEPPTAGSTPKPAPKPSSSDGPMVCEARNGGFDCKPKR